MKMNSKTKIKQEVEKKFNLYLENTLTKIEHPLYDKIKHSIISLNRFALSNRSVTNFHDLKIIETITGIKFSSIDELSILQIYFAKQMLVDYGCISSKSILTTRQIKNKMEIELSYRGKLSWLSKNIEIAKQKEWNSRCAELIIIRDDLINDMQRIQHDDLCTYSNIQNYRRLCDFKINLNNIRIIKGYEKLVHLGWYNQLNNPYGVVKDHRLSIKFGFDNKVPFNLVGHPANCEFLTVKENNQKSDRCSLTLDQLCLEIKRIDSLLD